MRMSEKGRPLYLPRGIVLRPIGLLSLSSICSVVFEVVGQILEHFNIDDHIIHRAMSAFVSYVEVFAQCFK